MTIKTVLFVSWLSTVHCECLRTPTLEILLLTYLLTYIMSCKQPCPLTVRD